MVRPSATIDLKGDDAHLNRVLANGERRVKRYASNVGRALKSVARSAAIILPAAGLAFAAKSVALAREQIQAEKKLEAVIRATGGAAGFTADELKKMAADLQKVTNFGDEVTISAQAVLATFKEIKGDVFIEAIKSAQDMSSVLDTDLKSSVLQLGKALNDPIRGITALSRAGVSFTQDQKDLIKVLQESGDIMGAQKVILAELKGEFGGAAEEMVDPLTQAFNSLGDSMEKIGLIALPSINEWAAAAGEALEGLSLLAKKVERNLLAAQSTRTPTEEARMQQLTKELTTLPTETDVTKAREKQAERRIAFKLAHEGRTPESETELAEFLAGQEATGRKDAAALDAPETAEERIIRERQTASPRELLELNEREAELAATRREGAQTTANLAEEEDKAAKAADKAADAFAKATAKREEEIDAFEKRIRDFEGVREEPAEPEPKPEPKPEPEPFMGGPPDPLAAFRAEPRPEPTFVFDTDQFISEPEPRPEPAFDFGPFIPGPGPDEQARRAALLETLDQDLARPTPAPFMGGPFQEPEPAPIPKPPQPVEPQGDRDKSADQIALDKLVVDPFRREELQGVIDENERRQKQRESDIEGAELGERLETPFEQLERSLSRFDRLLVAGSIDEEISDRARAEAVQTFQADIPDFGPSAADERADDGTEDQGFQARFEGITAAFTRISTAAASRRPDDQALKAAERSATATEETAGGVADVDLAVQGLTGVLVEFIAKPPAAAVAG